MKHIKKILIPLFLLGAIPTMVVPDQSNQAGNIDFDLMIDDPSLDALSMPADITRTPPQTIIEAISSFGGIQLLQQDLYLKTNPLNSRSLLYYPFIQPPRRSYAYPALIGAHVFFNQTRRAYFTADSSNITSYLGICQTDFLDLLSESVQKIQQFIPNFTINPLTIFPLFNDATVEERRIGAFFNAAHSFNLFTLRAMIPIYYLERNFIVGLAQREELETQLGATTDDEQKKFQKSHLISDKFGFGDTRATLDFPIIDREDLSLNVGIYSTIPTALSFGTGGLGSSFEQGCPRPDFDFAAFFPDSADADPAQIKAQATTIAQNFFIGALDQLSANLLETPLGNGGHFGLGGLIENDFALSNLTSRPWGALTWTNKLYAEYLFPKREKRFYVKRANPEAFAARNFNDPTQADSNLAFLNQEVVNRFYPFVYTTLVYPGFNFEWTTQWYYESRNGGIFIGNDIWMAGKERLADLNAGGQSLAFIDQSAAVKPIAFQSKVFGTIFLKANRETYVWTVSFNGDYTYASRGIGKDFTATVGLEVNY